ncbi:MAG: AAA family ATPase [Nanoarchaeota archaeon]|nr:AAA family ATPase [Nanoarchaeota archaeon]
MGLLSTIFKKRGQKLAKEQIEQIESKIQETRKRYSSQRKIKSVTSGKKTKQVNVKSKLINKSYSENKEKKFIKTGISGFDKLLEKGIPKSTSILVSGGAGSGKTIFCLQTLFNAAKNGEKCLYLSFEESEKRLKEHMDDFGWDWKELENKGLLKIMRKEPFNFTNTIEAMTEKAKGELLIDINEVLEIIPEGFIPDRIVLDSVTAIAAAFSGKEESYRIFIEQLFRYLESLHATTFLISETEQMPTIYSRTGVEEFLADGVIVLYAIRIGNIRENGIEVLKLRGAKHEKKIVAMQIKNKGIEVYPQQEVLSEMK